MNFKVSVYCVSAIAALMVTTPASANSQHSKVAFNNGIAEKTADQPANGATVAYQIKLQDGELDGCTVDIVESLYPRDGGKWGMFDITADVNCTNGSFAYNTSGAWDGNGFHASGHIKEGSGQGDFSGIVGRIAQLGGAVAAAAASDGTLDVSYELALDKSN